MKRLIHPIVTTCLLAALTTTSHAFSTPRAFTPHSHSPSTSRLSMELTPEPEGGTELSQIDSTGMTNSRMKNMGAPVEDGKGKVAKEVDGEEVVSFWLSAEAEGSFVQKIRTKLLKEAGKNANFPGFRKGQVPPYAQPQMTMFAVQEGIIRTCESAVAAYGLNSVPDEDGGSVEVLEDIKELVKGYKLGTDVPFTARFVATVDPEKRGSAVDGGEEGVEGAIDVEVE